MEAPHEHLSPIENATRAMSGYSPEPLHAIAWALISLAQSVDNGASAAFDVARAATQFFTDTTPDAFLALRSATKEFLDGQQQS